MRHFLTVKRAGPGQKPAQKPAAAPGKKGPVPPPKKAPPKKAPEPPKKAPEPPKKAPEPPKKAPEPPKPAAPPKKAPEPAKKEPEPQPPKRAWKPPKKLEEKKPEPPKRQPWKPKPKEPEPKPEGKLSLWYDQRIRPYDPMHLGRRHFAFCTKSFANCRCQCKVCWIMNGVLSSGQLKKTLWWPFGFHGEALLVHYWPSPWQPRCWKMLHWMWEQDVTLGDLIMWQCPWFIMDTVAMATRYKVHRYQRALLLWREGESCSVFTVAHVVFLLPVRVSHWCDFSYVQFLDATLCEVGDRRYLIYFEFMSFVSMQSQ